MPSQDKIDAVAEIKNILERASMVVSTNYRGLNVKEVTELRRKMREGNVHMRVIKNSLLEIAAKETDSSALMEVVEGPTALAISYDEDIVEAAKAISEYAKSAPSAFVIRGGLLEGSVVTKDQLEELTKIPPKPVLIAQIAGGLQSPLAGLVALFDSPLQELTQLLTSLTSELPGLIQARIQQLESQPQAAATE